MLLNISTFYLICASVNVLLGCLVSPGSRKSFGSPPQYDLSEFFALVFVPLFLLLRPFIYLAKLVYGVLYIGLRYASKYRLRRTSQISTSPEINKPRQSIKCMYQTANKPEHSADDYSLTLRDEEKDRHSPHNLRLPVEITILITQHLHHTDLDNLACSSHYLRTIFFGSVDPSTVAHSLHNFVRCDNSRQPNTSCVVCHIPICHVRVSHSPLFDELVVSNIQVPVPDHGILGMHNPQSPAAPPRPTPPHNLPALLHQVSAQNLLPCQAGAVECLVDREGCGQGRGDAWGDADGCPSGVSELFSAGPRGETKGAGGGVFKAG